MLNEVHLLFGGRTEVAKATPRGFAARLWAVGGDEARSTFVVWNKNKEVRSVSPIFEEL